MASFEPFPILETPRLRLRRITPDDTDTFLRLLSDPEVTRYYDRDAETRASVEKRLADIDRRIDDGTALSWAITLKDTGEMLGSAGFWKMNVEHRLAEIGYQLFPAWWGRGVMTEALRAILPYGFDVMGLHRVEGNTSPENVASIRVLKRLGFTRDGFLRESWRHGEHYLDTPTYGLLRADFEAAQGPRGKTTILGSAGAGSAISEAIFALAGLAYEVEDVDPWTEGASKERLRAVNPLLQVPTVILPNGEVMTESAAIALHAIDAAPEAGLAPLPHDPARARFLRWLVYIVASIYPTFTYGDDPSRYVTGEDARKQLRASTDAQREGMWRSVEAAAVGPWFLGAERSAIDAFVWPMVRWRPRRAWFEANCPKLSAIAAALDAEPLLAKVLARNFP